MKCPDKIKLLVTIGLFILIIFFIKFYLDNQNNHLENIIKNKKLDYLSENLINHESNLVSNDLIPINPSIMESPIISNLDLRKGDSLDQVFNPLRYPTRSPPYYNSEWYPSYNLPVNVVGCGGRREPCNGGSQVVIPNRYPQRVITNENIAPINIRTRGPEGEPQQVGTLYNLNSREQDVYPLFGRQRFPNDNKWEYYTIVGNYGAKIPVKPLRNYQEIGTNDILQLVNYPGNFKATIYKREDLQYIPYV